MKETYREHMDRLRFTEEEKQAMTDRLMAAAEQGSRRRTGLRPLRRLMPLGAAAALVLALGVGASAAGVLKAPAEVFSDLFGGRPAQTEIVDRIGRPIDASATADGITITADAILGDRHSYAIVYSIARADGTPLAEDLTPTETGLLPLVFEDGWTDVGRVAGRTGSSWFYDADPTDAAIQYVEVCTVDGTLEQGTASAQFRGLRLGEEEIAQGSWKLKFQFAFQDSTIALPAGQSFQREGMTYTLDAVELSPLSYQVRYTVDRAARFSDAPSGRLPEQDRDESGRFLNDVTVMLRKKDGTELDLTNSGGSIEPKKGTTQCRKGDVLPEIVPLDEVESLTIGGVTIPVDVEK